MQPKHHVSPVASKIFRMEVNHVEEHLRNSLNTLQRSVSSEAFQNNLAADLEDWAQETVQKAALSALGGTDHSLGGFLQTNRGMPRVTS